MLLRPATEHYCLELTRVFTRAAKMCRVGVLSLLASLVVACSCSSVARTWSNAPVRQAVIVNAHGPEAAAANGSAPVNVSGPVIAYGNSSNPGVNSSDPLVTNTNDTDRGFSVNRNDSRNSLANVEATSSTQAVIWVSSLLPNVFSPTYLCTGAVIGRDTVLTSATCVKWYSKGRLVVSEAQENLAESYRFANVASMTSNSGLDLAVLKVDVDEFFTQSSVSKMIDDADTLVTGDKCTVSGWLYGRTEWQIQNVSYMSSEDCIAAYSSVTTPINESMICANPEVGTSSCKQNVGWPLFCNGELAGLYSWTHFSCVRPGVYSSMKVSAPWISEATTSGAIVNASFITTIILLFYYLVCAYLP